MGVVHDKLHLFPVALPGLATATEADLPEIVALMNCAYRGRGGAAGWTTEAGYIEGDRASEDLLRRDMAASPEGTFLVWRPPPDGALRGWAGPRTIRGEVGIYLRDPGSDVS